MRLGEQPVGGDRVGHAGGLDRDLEVLEVQPLHQLHVLLGGGDERLHRLERSSSCRCLGSDPEFTPDAQRHLAALARSTTSRVFSWPADVARVDAHAVGAGVDRLEGQRVVEVDVRDHRDRRLAHDPPQRVHVLVARHGAAHQVRARVRDGVDLASSSRRSPRSRSWSSTGPRPAPHRRSSPRPRRSGAWKPRPKGICRCPGCRALRAYLA